MLQCNNPPPNIQSKSYDYFPRKNVQVSGFTILSGHNYVHFMLPVPPDILDYPTSTDMVVREGSNVSLRCAATGSPEPTIAWRREGGEPIPLGNGQEGTVTWNLDESIRLIVFWNIRVC
ncbi:hypothetical protein Zmor_002231 [Zophobas morio]|uniref:Ig-like domain-containing protein n=1 Tax=Zophobas morio TaxID=2755281 RepID=A0AA38MPW1_9CUCU|nr:hypothetical protein Zmor_002231 [Zophobas morio]